MTVGQIVTLAREEARQTAKTAAPAQSEEGSLMDLQMLAATPRR